MDKEKNEFVALRVPKRTKNQLYENAEKSGFLSISEYVRDIIRRELENKEAN
jgi:hypothetical protein